MISSFVVLLLHSSLVSIVLSAQFDGENMCTPVTYFDQYGNAQEFYCNPSERTQCEYQSTWLGAMDLPWSKYYWAECHCLRFQSERSCSNDLSCVWKPELLNDPEKKHPCRGNMPRPEGIVPAPSNLDLKGLKDAHDAAFLVYTDRIRNCWSSQDSRSCENKCLSSDSWSRGECRISVKSGVPGGRQPPAEVKPEPTSRPETKVFPPKFEDVGNPSLPSPPRTRPSGGKDRMCFWDVTKKVLPGQSKCRRNIQTECAALEKYMPALKGDFHTYYEKMCQCAQARDELNCNFFSFGECAWQGSPEEGFCTTNKSSPDGPIDWDMTKVDSGMLLAKDVLATRDLACSSAADTEECGSLFLLQEDPWYGVDCPETSLEGEEALRCRQRKPSSSGRLFQ